MNWNETKWNGQKWKPQRAAFILFLAECTYVTLELMVRVVVCLYVRLLLVYCD